MQSYVTASDYPRRIGMIGGASNKKAGTRNNYETSKYEITRSALSIVYRTSRREIV